MNNTKKRKRITKNRNIKDIREKDREREKVKKRRKKDINKNKKKREKNNLSYILRCPC